MVGSGSFGVVFKAQIEETGEMVAIKKVYQDQRYKNRELEIMKMLIHPNIVFLRHAFFTTGDRKDEVFLNIVMDFYPETLYRVMRHYAKLKQVVPILLVKLYLY